MTTTMKKIMSEILAQPYHKNYAATSGAVHNIAKHENAVEDVFYGFGLERVDRKVSIVERDEWLHTGAAPGLSDNSFISQPCGTHNSPDFIAKLDGKLYFIECKSAEGGAPMYNSGVPKAKYLYVFTSEKHNATTVYWGKDVLDIEKKRLIEEHIAAARRADEILNKKLADNGHGIQYYTRPMITHKGTKLKKDYFLNPKRSKLEKRVLNGV